MEQCNRCDFCCQEVARDMCIGSNEPLSNQIVVNPNLPGGTKFGRLMQFFVCMHPECEITYKHYGRLTRQLELTLRAFGSTQWSGWFELGKLVEDYDKLYAAISPSMRLFGTNALEHLPEEDASAVTLRELVTMVYSHVQKMSCYTQACCVIQEMIQRASSSTGGELPNYDGSTDARIELKERLLHYMNLYTTRENLASAKEHYVPYAGFPQLVPALPNITLQWMAQLSETLPTTSTDTDIYKLAWQLVQVSYGFLAVTKYLSRLSGHYAECHSIHRHGLRDFNVYVGRFAAAPATLLTSNAGLAAVIGLADAPPYYQNPQVFLDYLTTRMHELEAGAQHHMHNLSDKSLVYSVVVNWFLENGWMTGGDAGDCDDYNMSDDDCLDFIKHDDDLEVPTNV